MSQLEPERFDPRQRRLCPDGSCVGVIGADGRCRMCGAVDPEGPPGPGLSADAFQGGCATDDEELAAEALTTDVPADDQAGGVGFDPQRGLCPDGTCVGVLGADRRCKVCGLAAER